MSRYYDFLFLNWWILYDDAHDMCILSLEVRPMGYVTYTIRKGVKFLIICKKWNAVKHELKIQSNREPPINCGPLELCKDILNSHNTNAWSWFQSLSFFENKQKYGWLHVLSWIIRFFIKQYAYMLNCSPLKLCK